LTDLPAHKQFERQIERIHQLLEAEGSVITWDDHIPDPDNPDQARQIDVTIRRDGSLTLVECRIHKTPQDVTWIEELMGRRTSLGADAVIAVSASGFTKTAKEKAKHHGIILRDFASLSREEIQNWGRKWKLAVNYCEFTNVSCLFVMDTPKPPTPPRVTDADGRPLNPLMWRLLFQTIMRKLDSDRWSGVPCTVEMQVGAKVLVDNRPPASINLKANVRRIIEKVELASIVAYVDPVRAESHAAVAKYRLGETEIIENCDQTAMVMDLSQLKIPDRCCFDTAFLDAGRIVNMYISSIIGTASAMNCNIPMQFAFGYGDRNVRRFPRRHSRSPAEHELPDCSSYANRFGAAIE
jgi:hypothetical protein